MAQSHVQGGSAQGEQSNPDIPSFSPLLSPHSWDDYLTGPENELAFAGAQALVRGDREGISPLVVHGPSGVGKSRLLAGLVVEWPRRHPGAAIAHLDTATFAAACATAASQADGNGWAELRSRYRAVDLLVLEDIEGLERTPLALRELTHTLDSLSALGSAVVVSARAAPGQWPRPIWPARLVNRLLGGLTVRIDPPSLASRRRYLLEGARARGLALTTETVESLAETADGYRSLSGWLARLALEVRTSRGRDATERGPLGKQPRVSQPVTLDLAAVTALLAENTALTGPGFSIEQITRVVSTRFGVRRSALRGPSRQAAVVQARHLAMYLARVHTSLSLAAIGAYFGNRDPATVRHACKTVALRIADDPALAAVVASISHHAR
jgi:chromosomal replication initiator protein